MIAVLVRVDGLFSSWLSRVAFEDRAPSSQSSCSARRARTDFDVERCDVHSMPLIATRSRTYSASDLLKGVRQSGGRIRPRASELREGFRCSEARPEIQGWASAHGPASTSERSRGARWLRRCGSSSLTTRTASAPARLHRHLRQACAARLHQRDRAHDHRRSGRAHHRRSGRTAANQGTSGKRFRLRERSLRPVGRVPALESGPRTTRACGRVAAAVAHRNPRRSRSSMGASLARSHHSPQEVDARSRLLVERPG